METVLAIMEARFFWEPILAINAVFIIALSLWCRRAAARDKIRRRRLIPKDDRVAIPE